MSFFSFDFNGKSYTAQAYFDFSEKPYFIFVYTIEYDLIKEFGDEITIKSDGYSVLPRRHDYGRLPALREALFDSLSNNPSFRVEIGKHIHYHSYP